MLNEVARYKSVLRVEAQLHAQAAVLQGKQPTSIGQEDRVGSLPAFIVWGGGENLYFYRESNSDSFHLQPFHFAEWNV